MEGPCKGRLNPSRRGSSNDMAQLTSAQTSEQVPQRAGLPRLDMVSLFVVLASTLIGFGDAVNYGRYRTIGIVSVLAGCTAAWSMAWRRSTDRPADRRVAKILMVVAFTASFAGAVPFHGTVAVGGRVLDTFSVFDLSVVLMVLAATTAFLLVFSGRTYVALLSTSGLVTAACVAMVISSPAPHIDVWEMYQAASRGILHLHNVYTQHWSLHLPGEAKIFGYFPGSAVLLTPFYLVFGDVRYGILAALILSGLLIGKMSRFPQIAVFGVLLLLYPRITYSIEQSWSEPLVLLALLLMAWAVRRGRTGWAVVCFAALLTFQQYDVIFIPLAASWREFGVKRTAAGVALAGAFIAPWALTAPGAFINGTVIYDLHYAYASQSLSMFHDFAQVSGTLAYVLLALGVAIALVLAMRWTHKDGSFLLGCAVVLVTLNLFDRITRFNEWELAVGLTLAAAAELLSFRVESPEGHVLALTRAQFSGEPLGMASCVGRRAPIG